MKELLYKDTSYKVIGCAQKVHASLGPGFPESVYHSAMSLEFLNLQVPFETEKPVEVYYERHLVGQFRLDLVVDSKVIVELKAVERLTDDHIAQCVSYLKATKLRLAMLINFGQKNLDFKRVIV